MALKIKCLLLLIAITYGIYSESYCDSIIKGKDFYEKYFENLTQVSANMTYYYNGEGFGEPDLKSHNYFGTKIESKINNDNVTFWKYFIKNSIKKVIQHYPCETNKISAPKFTCGCAFVKFNYYFINNADTLTWSFNNCNVDSGILNFKKDQNSFRVSIEEKRIDGMLKYLHEIINVIIPKKHSFCGDF